MAATEYTIRRKMLVLLGAKFHIYAADGSLLGFCQQKAFKLKEDIRIYTDETKEQERVSIKARNVIDFGASYEVIDSRSNEKLGSLKRKGFASILRDSWIVIDPDNREIGKILEDSMALALLRRFIGIIPQTFVLRDTEGKTLAKFRTHFNPFVFKMTVTLEEDCHLNPMLILSAGLLLTAIEGRQE